ncbi:MAG: LytTR family transcriptional regulator DNA-binding domain-containing protein [Bacteroidia bacterium]
MSYSYIVIKVEDNKLPLIENLRIKDAVRKHRAKVVPVLKQPVIDSLFNYEKIKVRIKDVDFLYPANEIVFSKGGKDISIVYLKDGRHGTVNYSIGNLKKVLELHSEIMKVHNQYLVNIHEINRLVRDHGLKLIMNGFPNEEIPVSAPHRLQVEGLII